jgi:hypothetical protein
VNAIGAPALVDHKELRQEVEAWEALSPPDQLSWTAAIARQAIHDAIMPGLNERGFARIRLLDSPREFGLDVLEHFLKSISAQLGYLLPQTYENNLTALIRNEGKNYGSPATRGHQTNAELAFHSDRCDLNLLLYVRVASEGGDLSVISYEEAAVQLREKSTAAFSQLFQGFPFDLRDERIFPSIAWHWRPILWNTDAGIRGHYIRRFIEDSQRHSDCPRLTTDQIAALDEFDRILESLRPVHTFKPGPGELLIMDNYRVMHARSAYKDDEGDLEGRLAIRTWVAPFHSEELPFFMFPMTGALAGGCFRGGVGRGDQYRGMLGMRPANTIDLLSE